MYNISVRWVSLLPVSTETYRFVYYSRWQISTGIWYGDSFVNVARKRYSLLHMINCTIFYTFVSLYYNLYILLLNIKQITFFSVHCEPIYLSIEPMTPSGAHSFVTIFIVNTIFEHGLPKRKSFQMWSWYVWLQGTLVMNWPNAETFTNISV